MEKFNSTGHYHIIQSHLYSKYKPQSDRHSHSASVLTDKLPGKITDCSKEGLRGRVYQRVD